MFAGVYIPEPDESGQLPQVGMAFSPKVETISPHTVAFSVLGLQRHYPTWQELGKAVLLRAQVCHQEARAALAVTVAVAVQAAVAFPGLTIVPAGQESAYLAPLSPDTLLLPEEVAEILQQWGIRTLGQLAALPEAGLVARFGPLGQQMRQAAQGSLRRLFIPDKPPMLFSESTTLDTPLTMLEPLLFVVAHLLDQICQQLEKQALAATELQIELRLESRDEFRRTHRLPVPTRDRKALLQLIRLDLEAHRPDSEVYGVSLLAEPAPLRSWQPGFFTAARPEPEKLEVTLARLNKILGAGRYGTPVVLDTHQPDAVTLSRFVVPNSKLPPAEPAISNNATTTLSLRYFRPPRRAEVKLSPDSRPTRVEASPNIAGRVLQAAGPWPNSGHWWTAVPWAREDWDVTLDNGVLYRLFQDHLRRLWFLEGYYD